MGGGWDGQHDGTGTAPMPAGFEVPTDNGADLAKLRQQVRLEQAATAESLRRHATGVVAPSVGVAGLGEPNKEGRNNEQS